MVGVSLLEVPSAKHQSSSLHHGPHLSKARTLHPSSPTTRLRTWLPAFRSTTSCNRWALRAEPRRSLFSACSCSTTRCSTLCMLRVVDRLISRLMLLSKGWCVLFSSLLTTEWVRYYILAIMFYCFEGLLIVRQCRCVPCRCSTSKRRTASSFTFSV